MVNESKCWKKSYMYLKFQGKNISEESFAYSFYTRLNFQTKNDTKEN